MSEFKAQILAVLLVIGAFGVLSTRFDKFFNDTFDNIESQLNANTNSSN